MCCQRVLLKDLAITQCTDDRIHIENMSASQKRSHRKWWIVTVYFQLKYRFLASLEIFVVMSQSCALCYTKCNSLLMFVYFLVTWLQSPCKIIKWQDRDLLLNLLAPHRLDCGIWHLMRGLFCCRFGRRMVNTHLIMDDNSAQNACSATVGEQSTNA